MIIFFLYLLFIIISIEATTELLSKSMIFNPLREYFFNRRINSTLCKFINYIFDCPYCMSVWVSFFYLILFSLYFTYSFHVLLFLPTLLVLHRLSNIIHFIIDRISGAHL